MKRKIELDFGTEQEKLMSTWHADTSEYGSFEKRIEEPQWQRCFGTKANKTFKQNISRSPRTSPADCTQHTAKVDSQVLNVTGVGWMGRKPDNFFG